MINTPTRTGDVRKMYLKITPWLWRYNKPRAISAV